MKARKLKKEPPKKSRLFWGKLRDVGGFVFAYALFFILGWGITIFLLLMYFGGFIPPKDTALLVVMLIFFVFCGAVYPLGSLYIIKHSERFSPGLLNLIVKPSYWSNPKECERCRNWKRSRK